MSTTSRRSAWPVIGGVAGVLVISAVFLRVLHIQNAATVSTTFLLVVLLVAASSTLVAAVTTSVVAMLCFNFFFLPPVRTFTVADPQNWVAIVAFLAVSVVGSNLSSRVRSRAEEASARRAELARLYDLSRDVLMVGDAHHGHSALAHAVARRFDLAFVAVAVPAAAGDWDVAQVGTLQLELPPERLSASLDEARRRVEFDAEARTYAGHRVIEASQHAVALVPLRVGTRPIGLLATLDGVVEAGTLDAIGGLVAMALERLHMLEERREAALLRQSEELKTTLLASLGHDLRTPLTAIRIGVENLRAAQLPDEERNAQAALVLAEAAQLDRLFQNLLDMARLEAGGVALQARRTHPSEIIEAARAQVADMLAAHVVREDLQVDEPAYVDPRLTATALARLLENAAQHAPAGSTIDVVTRRGGEALLMIVRDHGPGIPAHDLPHLFERFYRGSGGVRRPAGTGMGLWIARGLLAAEGGEIWGENAPDGGAVFTIRLPDRDAPDTVPHHA